jgi:hypothetical protein
MLNPFKTIINILKTFIEFIKTFVRVRPVLTRAESKQISNEQNSNLIFELASILQTEVEKAAKDGHYKATICADHPLDVFSCVAKIFHGRGFATRVYRKFKPAKKSEENSVFYLEVSWGLEEKSGESRDTKTG